MGSDSDLGVMKDAAEVLEQFGIDSEVRVLSCHRAPEKVVEYVHDAPARGIKVFIGGAGMSAGLPGVIAAHTELPVIGVPLLSASSAAGGLDSILSVMQLPPGIPVAAVALNGAKNAGILAAQIIATSDEEVKSKLTAYKKKMETDILAKNEKLEKEGYKKYLENK